MKLSGLITVLDIESFRGAPETEIHHVAFDSRRVQPSALFCCVPGAEVDGHDFAAAAVAAGAVALLVERELDLGVPQIRVADARRAMALAADAVYGHPSHRLSVLGITGTNGKTTTAMMLRSIMEQSGRRAEVRGTLTGARTTPEAPDLQEWFSSCLTAGIEAVAMEVSSHALSLHRVDGTRFAAAVFTNLGRDHLDFHRTMDAYFAAKARLFTETFTGRAVVNLDDPYGRLLRDAATVATVGYSLDDAEDLVVGPGRSTFSWHGRPLTIRVGGRFNVSNALAAAETARMLGIDLDAIAAGLDRDLSIPGRFEAIEEGQAFRVIVDFAHTPDALAEVLASAREIASSGRVHVLFGCGGDRDRSKRPAMGEVAARLADRVVLTADNSRHEDTRAIISAVKAGFERASGRIAGELVVEEDRDRAIGVALGGARPGDVVILAGKGHERTQTIGEQVFPFDDAEVARQYLRSGPASETPGSDR